MRKVRGPVLALALVTCLAAGSDDESQAAAFLRSSHEEQAATVLEKALDREPPPDERARLYVLLGIARFNLRDPEGARHAFRRAFESDASVELPAQLASPRVREAFEAERRAAPASPGTRARRWAGVGIGLLGVGGAVASIALQLRALDVRREAEVEPVAVRALELDAQAQQLRTASLVALAVGVTLLTAGALIALLPSPAADTAVSVLLLPTEIAAGFAVRW